MWTSPITRFDGFGSRTYPRAASTRVTDSRSSEPSVAIQSVSPFAVVAAATFTFVTSAGEGAGDGGGAAVGSEGAGGWSAGISGTGPSSARATGMSNPSASADRLVVRNKARRRTARKCIGLARSETPRHARILREIVDERDIGQPGGDEAIAHGGRLIEAVLEDERTTGCQVRERGARDAVVEREAVSPTVERQ